MAVAPSENDASGADAHLRVRAKMQRHARPERSCRSAAREGWNWQSRIGRQAIDGAIREFVNVREILGKRLASSSSERTFSDHPVIREDFDFLAERLWRVPGKQRHQNGSNEIDAPSKYVGERGP